MVKILKKKRKITRNKVIGSIQLTIGLLLLISSIFMLFTITDSLIAEIENNDSPYNDVEYMTSLQNAITKVINSSEMTNATKEIILKEYETQIKLTVTAWNLEKSSTVNLMGNIIICSFITFILSLLFITQGIVNFGLDKLKHE